MQKTTHLRWLCVAGLALLAGCDALISTQQRVENARAALSAGDLGRAAIELRKAMRSEAENPAVRLLLARFSLETGDAGAAQLHLDHATKAGAKHSDTDPLQARIWIRAHKPQELLDALARAQLALPEPERTLDLARAYDLLGRPAAALDTVAPLLSAQPELGDAREIRAEALLLQGKPDAALEEVSRAARDRTSVDAPLLQGQLLAQRQQFAAAEEALVTASQRISKSTPITERIRVLASLTEARLAQGKLNDADASRAALAKLLPDSPMTVLLTARIKLARGNTIEGIADLQGVVERLPNFVPARLLLGSAQLAQGNFNQAQKEFEQILQQSPDNMEARKLSARARLQLNQPQEALRVLTLGLDDKSTDPQLYALLEAAQIELGDPAAAVAVLERGVRANPVDPRLKAELARAYLATGRAKDAFGLLEPAGPQDKDLRRERLYISALYAVRGPGAAAEEVERLLRARPKDIAAFNVAASYFTSQWQADRAHALLQQALAIDAHDRESLANAARLDLMTGQLAAAEAHLRTLLTAEPHDVQATVALADILARRGARADAEEVLAGEKDSKAPELQLATAQLELMNGDMAKATAALDRAIELQPTRTEVLSQAGILLMRAGQYEAALARFKKAVERAPQSAQNWLSLGGAQLALKRDAEAGKSFAKAQELKPDWAPAVGALALLDVRAKRVDAALQRVKDLRSKHPADADALVLEGDVLASADRLSAAASAYGEAQKLRPDATTALKLFRIRSAAGAADADEPLQQWLALQPNDYSIRTVLGNYYLGQHQLLRAADEFEALIRQRPGDAPGLNNLAWIYFQMNDPRAQSVAQRAYQLAPSAPSVADTLGWILLKQRELAQALPLLDQARKAAKDDPEIQYHYAYALVQSGKRAEARDILTHVLANKGEFQSRPDAERLLSGLEI